MQEDVSESPESENPESRFLFGEALEDLLFDFVLGTFSLALFFSLLWFTDTLYVFLIVFNIFDFALGSQIVGKWLEECIGWLLFKLSLISVASEICLI